MSRVSFVIYFSLVTLFWGGSFLGIRYAIAGFSPFFAAFLRVFSALLFLLVLFVFKRQKNLKHDLSWQALGIGIFSMGIPWVMLFWAEKFIEPGVASILNSSVPLFVTIFAPFVTPSDRLSLNKWLGVLVGFFGVVLIFYPEIKLGEWTTYIQGLLAVIVMAISYAIGILWTRRLTSRIRNEINLFYQLISACLFLLLFSFLFGGDFILPQFSYVSVLAVLYLGIMSTALALLMFYHMIKYVGSVQASAVTYLVPLLAIILDLIFLKKAVTLNQGVGASLILLAIFVINRK